MPNNLSITGVTGRNWSHNNYDSKGIDKKIWGKEYERSRIEFSLSETLFFTGKNYHYHCSLIFIKSDLLKPGHPLGNLSCCARARFNDVFIPAWRWNMTSIDRA
jgi:hypothetical protein